MVGSLSAVDEGCRQLAVAVGGTVAVDDCKCLDMEIELVGQEECVGDGAVVALGCTALVHAVSVVVVERAERAEVVAALRLAAEWETGQQLWE
jgi:hypothetical protein